MSIRQFLIRGDEIGLFEFPPREKPFYLRITKETLLESLLRYESISKVGKHHKASFEQIKEAMKTYKISMRDIQSEINKRKALKTYEELVRELGHHPSTTEIKIRHHYLLFRIKKIWGSIYEFRKAYGFPGSKIGSPVKNI
ncbi:MAG: hypothetical protein KKI13_05715 [Candidatus Omnitrophica bacterium]|nr:hypothetical protein [Candidatus Omnitrophota bacterium]